MALRLIEVYLPEEHEVRINELLKDQTVLDTWRDKLSDNQLLIRILLPAEQTETIVDLLRKNFSSIEGFRILLLRVEASIPRPEPEEKPKAEQEEVEVTPKPEKKSSRISREELYADIAETTNLSWVYILLVILSSIVAAIGILRGNVPAIIGAMVIAPLLGPNVALSLATTLGDITLTNRALKTNALGLLVGLFFAAIVGLIFTVNPNIPEIAARTQVSLGDILLALAAGSAAALSFTTGVPTALIGVMVAVAILPPLVTLGMLIGSGYWPLAIGALLLLCTNLICVNLAGVMTFLAQGIRPMRWWEAARAKKATRKAIAIWTLLLVVLVLVILLSQRS